MKRLCSSLALLSVATPLSFVTAAETATAGDVRKQPNIVFILTDDHAWQAISAYGDERKLISTPHIDRLAREGMRFDRCLVTNALCGPSRASILTGTYSHINGFVNNSNCRFDSSQPTFPKLLHAAGYQTAMIGKWHLETDPTGFDFWQIVPGQGIYYNPPMIRNGEPVATTGYVTDVITDVSIDWLQRRDKTKPFMLLSWQKAPHRSWEPALRDLDFDGGRQYAEPPTLFDDYSGRGPAVREQDMTIRHTLNEADLKLVPVKSMTDEQRRVWDDYYGPRNAAFQAANLQGDDFVRWKYQRYMHDYLACVRGVDDNVGRLLAYLGREGLLENTIIVYSSDQGFFLGEHGWFDKRWAFEESLRTPLIVRWPEVIKPGSINKDIVSTVDFAETFLDAAQVPVPARMQGRSLLPLFKGERPADWRTSYYYSYYEYPAFHRVQPHEVVVTDRYKLVHFFGKGNDYWELYDNAVDPREMSDVHGKMGYGDVQGQLGQELKRLRMELKVPAPIPSEWFGIDTQYPAHLKMPAPVEPRAP